MKRVLSVVVATLIFSLLAISAQAEENKLVIMMPGTVYPEGVIDGFKAKYPHLEIEVIAGGWDDNLTKIPVMAAGGVLPDVWYGEAGRAAEWGYNGLLEDLKPYIDRDLRVEDYFFLEASSDTQGRVWGIPGGFQMTTLFYLPHLFDAAGVAYPHGEWTVDDLVEAGRKMTIRRGDRAFQFGFGRPTEITTGYMLWMRLMGGKILDETRTRSLLNTPETVRAVEFIRDLMWTEEISPKPTETGFSFARDNLAMKFEKYVQIAGTINQGVINFDVEKVPIGPGGHRSTTVVPNVWMIGAQSQAKEAAWNFIKYYLSDEVQEKVVAKQSEVPVTRSVASAFLAQAAPPTNYAAVLESFEFAQTLEENAAWETWRKVLGTELQTVFRNEQTASNAMARAHEAVQLILDSVYQQ